MITNNDVINAFTWMLGRPPENEAVIEQYTYIDSIEELRLKLFLTDEMYNQVRSHGKIVRSNTWVCADLTNSFGIYLWLDLHDRGVSLPCLTGEYEPIETRMVKKFLNPGDCFVDIGANIGWFSMHAANVVGSSGKVISFEPSPIIYPWTVKSAKFNGFSNIISVYHYALSDKSSYLLLDRGELTHNPGGSSANNVSSQFTASDKHLVKAVIGDKYIYDAQPNFIKIDVEGAELRALRGIEQTIRSAQPIVMCEINPAALNIVSACTVKDILNFFKDMNYTQMRVGNNNLNIIHEHEVLLIEEAWYNLVFVPTEISEYISTVVY